MEKLKFTQNWNNKLNNYMFTTIRPVNPTKYKVGEHFQVFLKSKTVVDDERFPLEKQFYFVKEVKCIEVRVYSGIDVPSILLGLDTGYYGESARKLFQTMFKNYPTPFDQMVFCVMLLETVKRKA